jgi:hypothetical protein
VFATNLDNYANEIDEEEHACSSNCGAGSLGYIWEASTVGCPPSLNKDNHKLNIECYKNVVNGTHNTFPKCLPKM